MYNMIIILPQFTFSFIYCQFNIAMITLGIERRIAGWLKK